MQIGKLLPFRPPRGQWDSFLAQQLWREARKLMFHKYTSFEGKGVKLFERDDGVTGVFWGVWNCLKVGLWCKRWFAEEWFDYFVKKIELAHVFDLIQTFLPFLFLKISNKTNTSSNTLRFYCFFRSNRNSNCSRAVKRWLIVITFSYRFQNAEELSKQRHPLVWAFAELTNIQNDRFISGWRIQS